MKYSHKSTHRKTCPHDPDYRAQLGFRLRTVRCNMGWSIADAAKYFQVTERTWHNWESGAHRIPFAVYKLCRVLARLELHGEGWSGWSFQGNALITPEGRQIEPRDSSWWSLMVRNAQSFSAAYNEATRLRMLIAGMESQRQASAEGAAEAAGLVPSKTKVTQSSKVTDHSTSIQHQDDVIMPSWPILYDSQTPLTPLHAPRPTPSESALTPCSVLPWTPICGVQLMPIHPHLKQKRRNQSGPCLTPMGEGLTLSQNPPELKNRPSMNGKKPNENACSDSSARPAAAQAAKLASAQRGTL